MSGRASAGAWTPVIVLTAAIHFSAYESMMGATEAGGASDRQQFLDFAMEHFGYAPGASDSSVGRLEELDQDLPLLLFVARESGWALEKIVALRARRTPWRDIFEQTGIGFDRLFVGLDRDPGPLYGNGWKLWRNRKSDRPLLSDEDIVPLVLLQIAHRLTGRAPVELVQRGGPSNLFTVVVEGHPRGRRTGSRDRRGDEDDDGDDDRWRRRDEGDERDRWRDRGRDADQGIPHGHLPPPGECRVWYDDRPPGQQPPPTDCATARREARRTRGRVIYGHHERRDEDR